MGRISLNLTFSSTMTYSTLSNPLNSTHRLFSTYSSKMTHILSDSVISFSPMRETLITWARKFRLIWLKYSNQTNKCKALARKRILTMTKLWKSWKNSMTINPCCKKDPNLSKWSAKWSSSKSSKECYCSKATRPKTNNSCLKWKPKPKAQRRRLPNSKLLQKNPYLSNKSAHTCKTSQRFSQWSNNPSNSNTSYQKTVSPWYKAFWHNSTSSFKLPLTKPYLLNYWPQTWSP